MIFNFGFQDDVVLIASGIIDLFSGYLNIRELLLLILIMLLVVDVV